MTSEISSNNVIWTSKTGQELVRDRLANKGTAFTKEERKLFGISGFFPEATLTLQDQIKNIHAEFLRLGKDHIGQYNYLNALRNRNMTLFYAFIMSYPTESVPIIYTPVVGEACQRFSKAFRFPDGLFLDPDNLNEFEAMLHHLEYFSVDAANIAVVTDGEGILGLGDLGIDGMGIPIGKLSLYVAGSGIYPFRTLPITLDIGTNNHDILTDEHYKGRRQPRLDDDEYYLFLEQFVLAFKKYLPSSILQFEDFSKQRAITLLEKYQDRLPCFNDDIQGTGGVVLAGLYNAVKMKEVALKDQKFVIYGFGAGGYGVAYQIYYALLDEGLTDEEARARIYTVDSKGLITSDRNFSKEPYKKAFAKDVALVSDWKLDSDNYINLEDILRNTKAEVLLGLSTQPNSFTHRIVNTMLEYTERPIIFPLSNPTSKSEANPQVLYEWTKGGVITATGSPYPNVKYDGKEYIVGQGNNLFIFPGIGLGASFIKAKKIAPEMFIIAAKAVAKMVEKETLAKRSVYPPITRFREVCVHVAAEVAKYAIESKIARVLVDGDIEEEIAKNAWKPLEGYFELKKL